MNEIKEKRIESFLEIIILLVATFSFSFFIYEVSKGFGNFNSPVIPLVSADSTSPDLGCCVDPYQGTYDPNVEQAACKTQNGTWYSDATCTSVSGSAYGCCVLGRESQMTTDTHCQRLSEILGFQKTWEKNTSREKCADLAKNQTLGACISTSRICKVITKQECLSAKNTTNVFHENYLCTEPALNTSCRKTDKTMCIEGEAGVYYMDSCGNRGNVYDSTRYDNNDYWSIIFPSNQLCGQNSGNANSKTCGNCNLFLGGFCTASKDSTKPIQGDYFCKSTSCRDEDGNTRLNGESWCIYDGKVGAGRDTVGSRHWKYVCSMGEIRVEPCMDYRQEVCTQTTKTVQGKEISYAECAYNPWRNCIAANGAKGGASGEACDTQYCIKKTVAIDKFKFDACAPKWPAGFEFSNAGNVSKGASQTNEICGIAKQTCTVIYIKQVGGACKCEINCGCEEQTFTDQMNEVCRSLGDCGGYVNWQGKYTDGGYTISGAPKVSPGLIKKYQSYATPTKGEYIEPFYNESGGSYKIAGVTGNNPEKPKPKQIMGMNPVAFAGAVMAGVGGVGIAAVLGGLIEGVLGAITAVAGIALLIVGLILFFLFLGVGSVCKTVKVTYDCKRWTRPKGCSQEVADKCNDNPLQPCSEYRCKSLGAACKIVNKGTANEKCVAEKNDGVNPVIKADMNYSTEKGRYNIKEENGVETGFSVTGKEPEGCIRAYTPIKLGITTSKLAQCKYDFADSSFDQMTMDFKDAGDPEADGEYFKKHFTTFFAPEPWHLITYDPVTGQFVVANWTGKIDIFVKCSDIFGNENAEKYTINTCVIPREDAMPPEIVSVSPAQESFVGMEETSLNAEFVINEPSECKWSVNDTVYDSMIENMTCASSINQGAEDGYHCSADLTLGEGEELTYYVRCKDQPWLDLDANMSVQTGFQRNVMDHSYIYKLKRGEEPLNITEVSPTGTKEVSTSPAEIELSVSTEGGAGSTKCYWQVGSKNNMNEFFTTGGTEHTQTLTSMILGGHQIYVECIDEAGDNVEKNWNLVLQMDSNGPIISSIGGIGDIIINTDEPAKCLLYQNAQCTGEGDEVDSDYTTSRTISKTVSSGTQRIYIKCVDEFGNQGRECKSYIIQ